MELGGGTLNKYSKQFAKHRADKYYAKQYAKKPAGGGWAGDNEIHHKVEMIPPPPPGAPTRNNTLPLRDYDEREMKTNPRQKNCLKIDKLYLFKTKTKQKILCITKISNKKRD
jgi:hypothetical protein